MSDHILHWVATLTMGQQAIVLLALACVFLALLTGPVTVARKVARTLWRKVAR